MSRPTWTVTAAAVLCAMTGPPAGAQERLPEGVAARVGEEAIAEREFRDWLRAALKGESPASAPLDPPRFRRCVAAELRHVGEGEPTPSRRALRHRCRTRYDALRASTMAFLVNGVWLRQETAARGLAVPPERVRRSFERQKRQAFANERDFRRFLRVGGLTEADILVRVELAMLQRRLNRAAVANVPEVTSEEVDRYYAAHRRQYRRLTPARARRAVHALLTARREQRALARFIARFRSRYRAITVCADGYVVSECSNAPAP